jgi:hypothetical protein
VIEPDPRTNWSEFRHLEAEHEAHRVALRVAVELVSHAALSAKKLGKPITPERAVEIVQTVVQTVPDPEFAALIVEKARELTEA